MPAFSVVVPKEPAVVLKLWGDETNYCIAETAEEARRIALEWAGGSEDAAEPIEEWSEWPADKPFTFVDEDGSKTSMLPAQWCAAHGPGYFASTEY